MTTPGRLLFIDDDPLLRRAYARILRVRGWTVDEATDGRDALARIGTQAFDVIVSDISMPQMDGLEFLAIVHATDPDLPVILLTGDPRIETAVRAVERGAFRYLIKPVDIDTLDDAARLAARFYQATARMPDSATRARVRASRTEVIRGVNGTFGSDGEVRLPEIVQLLAGTRRTGILRISHSAVTGEVQFLAGAIVDARCAERRGETAFYEVLAAETGEFSFDPAFAPETRTIERSSESLLLEAMLRLDEASGSPDRSMGG
jgi:CheY-like chemotaxis protein